MSLFDVLMGRQQQLDSANNSLAELALNRAEKLNSYKEKAVANLEANKKSLVGEFSQGGILDTAIATLASPITQTGNALASALEMHNDANETDPIKAAQTRLAAQGIRDAFNKDAWVGINPDTGERTSSLHRRVLGNAAVLAAQGSAAALQGVVGLASIPTLGLAGKVAEEAGFRPKDGMAELEKFLTPEMQLVNKKVTGADGFSNTIEEILNNPSAMPSGIVKSLPSMLFGGGIGKALGLLPGVGTGVAGALGEGAMMAGSTAEAIREKTTDGRLTLKQALLAAGTGVMGAGVGFAGNKLAGALRVGDIDEAIVTGAMAKTPRGIGSSTVLSGAIEGGEELLQSGGETIAQNIALNKPYDEGLGNAAATGMMTGAPMGAFGGLGGIVRDKAKTEIELVKTKVEIQEAAKTNNFQAFTDPTTTAYAPEKAIGVLNQNSKLDTTTPEAREANLEEAKNVMADFEDTIQSKRELRSFMDLAPEAKQAKLDGIKAKIAGITDTTDPVQQFLLKGYQENLAGLEAANKPASNKDKKNLEAEIQLMMGKRDAGNNLIQDLNKHINGNVTPEQSKIRVAEANATVDPKDVAAVEVAQKKVKTLFNQSMIITASLSADEATALADNTSNALTDPQRDYFRKFSAARIAENTLKTTKGVAQEVLLGTKDRKTLGIENFRNDLGHAISLNNKKDADYSMGLLSSFVSGHTNKANTFVKALQDSEALNDTTKFIQVVATKKPGEWVQNTGKLLTDVELKQNGGKNIHKGSSELVNAVVTEANALNTFNSTQEAAYAMKFDPTATLKPAVANIVMPVLGTAKGKADSFIAQLPSMSVEERTTALKDKTDQLNELVPSTVNEKYRIGLQTEIAALNDSLKPVVPPTTPPVVPPVAEVPVINPDRKTITTKVVHREKLITPEMLVDEPNTLFVFGDNESRSGSRGQAKVMRNAKNAAGVRTKVRPSMSDGSFWSDANLEANKAMIDEDFKRIEAHNGPIVFSTEGLGTGLSKLQEKAPDTLKYINSKIAALENPTVTPSATITNTPLTGFVNHSGGAIGADTAWGEDGNAAGVVSNHYRAGGMRTVKGSVTISPQDYEEGKVEAAKAAKRNWGFKYPRMKMDELIRNWAQVKYSDAVFAVSSIVASGESVFPDQPTDERRAIAPSVTGGTGYAVGMAINHGKPVYVYNQKNMPSYPEGWYTWDAKANNFVATEAPVLTKNFAGIGSRNLTVGGRQAIKDVYAATQASLNTVTPPVTATPVVAPAVTATSTEAAPSIPDDASIASTLETANTHHETLINPEDNIDFGKRANEIKQWGAEQFKAVSAAYASLLALGDQRTDAQDATYLALDEVKGRLRNLNKLVDEKLAMHTSAVATLGDSEIEGTPTQVGVQSSSSPEGNSISIEKTVEVEPRSKEEPTGGQEVKPVEVEKAGALSALSKENRSKRGTPFRQRNLLADHLVQTAGSSKDATLRPLVAVKDFLSAWIAEPSLIFPFLKDIKTTEDLSEEQTGVIAQFQKLAQQWSPIIQSSLIQGSWGKNNVINPPGEWAFEDLVQFLLINAEDKDGNPIVDLEENLKTAMSLAGYLWVAEQAGNLGFNDDKAVNKILQRDEDTRPSKAEQDLLRDVGSVETHIKNTLGQKVIAAMGMTMKGTAPEELMSRLEGALGAHILKLLSDPQVKLVERTALSGREFYAIGHNTIELGDMEEDALTWFQELLDSPDWTKEVNDEIYGLTERGGLIIPPHLKKGLTDKKIGHLQTKLGEIKKLANTQTNFVRVARKADGELTSAVDAIFKGSKGTESLLNKLFSVEGSEIAPSMEPVTDVQTTTKGTKQGVPLVLQKYMKKEDNDENYLKEEVVTFLEAMEAFPEAMQAILGVVPIVLAEDDRPANMHITERKGVEAKNKGIIRGHESLMTFIRSMKDRTAPFYMKHSVWLHQRVGILATLMNPQANKEHRTAVTRTAWSTEVDPANEYSLNNFKLRVMEAFGVKTEKGLNTTSVTDTDANGLTAYDRMINNPVVQEAVAILEAVVINQSEGFTEETANKVKDAVAIGKQNTHTLDALIGLAQQKAAEGKPFTTQTYGEIDGVANGVILQHLVMGAAATVNALSDLLIRGGMITKNTAKFYGEWRSKQGNYDVYEANIFNVEADLIEMRGDPALANTLDSLTFFNGTLVEGTSELDRVVTKAGRDAIKNPLTTLLYGSAMNTALTSMSETFVDKIYAEIVKVGKVDGDPSLLIAKINQMIPAPRKDKADLRLPANMGIRELMERRFTKYEVRMFHKAFKETMGVAVQTTIERNFASLLESQKVFNKTAKATFDLYNAVRVGIRNAYIEKRMNLDNRDPDFIDFKMVKDVRTPIHGLTSAQEKEIADQLVDILPLVHTPMSKEDGDVNNGLLVGKVERGVSQEAIYGGKVNFKTPFDNNGAKSVMTKGNSTEEVEPGVGLLAKLTQALDSAVSHSAAFLGSIINIHDAHVSGLKEFRQTAINLNQATWKVTMGYSPMEEMQKALERVILGVEVMLQDKNLPAEVRTNLVTVIDGLSKGVTEKDYLSLLVRDINVARYKADSTKFGFGKDVTVIDQYAHEGGQYVLTDQDRASVQTKLDKVNEGVTFDKKGNPIVPADPTISDAIDSIIGAVYGRRGQTAQATSEEAGSVFGTLGTPKIAPEPGLVELFNRFKRKDKISFKEVVGNLKRLVAAKPRTNQSRFEYALLSKLYDIVPESFTVTYVTEETKKPEGAPAQRANSSGWTQIWGTSGNINEEIYVLGTDFVDSALTTELLIHELLHAALGAVITKAMQVKRGDAYALVQSLEKLRQSAIEYVKAKPDGPQYSEALKDIHEFVSWGMSNQDFQDNVLSEIEATPEVTKEGGWGNGLFKFIDHLVKLIFGDKATPDMRNGMTSMVANASKLMQVAQNNPVDQEVEMTAMNASMVNPLDPLNTESNEDAAYSISPSGVIKGVTFKDKGIVAINTSLNMTPKQIHALKLHEIGVHYGLERMLGKEEFDKLLLKIESLKGKSAAVDRAYAAVPANTRAELVNEEALAYMVENYHNMPEYSQLSFLQKLIADVKKWYIKTFNRPLPFEEDAYILASAALAMYSDKVKIVEVLNLSDKPAPGFVKLNFDTALKSSPYMHILLDKVVDALGSKAALTGSLAMSNDLDIYRHVDEQIHDLDFRYYGDYKELIADLRSKLPEADLIRAFYAKKDNSFVVTVAMPVPGVKILSVAAVHGNKEFLVTGTVNGGEPQILSPKLYNAVDFFVHTPPTTPLKTHTYKGKDGGVREVTLVPSVETFEAKLAMGRDKDVRDAILAGVGDFAMSQGPNPNTANPLEKYTTQDIYASLGTGAISEGFDAHLREVLNGIVNRLQGPYGTFRDAIAKSTAVTQLDAYAAALATGNAPFAMQTLASPFKYSNQEAFVAEMVAATIQAALDDNNHGTSSVLSGLRKEFVDASKRLKPQDFDTDPAIAQDKYDFIFNRVDRSPAGLSQQLAQFAAMGIAHEGFSNMLKEGSTREAVAPVTGVISNNLNKMWAKVLEFFHGKMTKTFVGQPVDSKLVSLVSTLVGIENKKRASLEKNAKNFLAPVEDMANKAVQSVQKTVAKAASSKMFRDSKISAVKGASAIVSVLAADRVPQVLALVTGLRDKHFNGTHGVLMGTINYMKGPDVVMNTLLQMRKLIEGNRKKLITEVGMGILQSFADKGAKVSKEAKEAATKVLLRSGAHILMGPYSLVELEKIIRNTADRSVAIRKYEDMLKQFPTEIRNEYLDQSRVLGYHLATGETKGEHLLKNAENIAKAYGSSQFGKQGMDSIRVATGIIDALVSLYAIEYAAPSEQKQAADLMDSENKRTDGGNGIDALLLTQKSLEQDAIERLFGGNMAQMAKGYTPEIYNPNIGVKVVTLAEGEKLKDLGYKTVGPVLSDPHDPLAELKQMYTLQDGGLMSWVSGIFSLTSMESKGTKHHSDHAANLQKRLHKTKQTAWDNRANPGKFDPTKIKGNFMAPVLDENGLVTNYAFLMHNKTKDSVLQRENAFDQVMGVLAGSIYDKETTKEGNLKALNALHDEYLESYASNAKGYVVVGPTSSDPELRELYALLPYDTREAIKDIWGSESMRVRADMLDIFFGYRKLSLLSRTFDKEVADRVLAEKMYGFMVEYMLDSYGRLRTRMNPNDAAKYRNYSKRAGVFARRAEKGWQELVHETKDIIVVKSGATLLGNELSNISLLKLWGVGAVDILKGKQVGMKAAEDYFRDSARLNKLEQQIKIGYLPATVAESRREIAVLKGALERNPARVLIERGLMPSIVEDIGEAEDTHSYKAELARKVGKYTDKMPEMLVKAGRGAYMAHDTRLYKWMDHMTKMSDFTARYTLYNYLTTRKDKPMTSDEALHEATESFVNYDIAMPRKLQYLDDMGILMFTKYFLSIQRVLAKHVRERPGKVLSMLVLNHYFEALPLITDSSFTGHLFNNPFGVGALRFPFVLDDIAVPNAMLSPFR